jgi:hypothetical protein
VLDVSGPGIVGPEYRPSRLVCAQSTAVQLLTLRKS